MQMCGLANADIALWHRFLAVGSHSTLKPTNLLLRSSEAGCILAANTACKPLSTLFPAQDIAVQRHNHKPSCTTRLEQQFRQSARHALCTARVYNSVHHVIYLSQPFCFITEPALSE